MPENKKEGCAFCGSAEGRVIFPKEMNFGTRKPYRYLDCAACGGLSCQDEVPIAEAYPPEYFSFQKVAIRNGLAADLQSVLRSIKTALLLNRKAGFRKAVAALFSEHYLFPWFRAARVTKRSAIMDIGCGTGGLLLYLKDCGFEKLTGIDPYIPTDLVYANGLSIQKEGLGEVEGKYDFLIFHHVFEHTPDPLASISKTGNILKEDGHILIIAPVADCFAYRKYGVYWASLDAPRHLAIPTKRSLQCVAEKAGLRIVATGYVPNDRQLWNSELFLADISMIEADRGQFKGSALDSKRRRRALVAEAERLDARQEGDIAVFLLKRNLGDGR
ncbi:MAG: class I SAM-dependent methyltransferase [Deltaproteobacteria bacterium]|nr:class I SAM-dependent methyltransferase [Deltaproteobacteria bacterium]